MTPQSIEQLAQHVGVPGRIDEQVELSGEEHHVQDERVEVRVQLELHQLVPVLSLIHI